LQAACSTARPQLRGGSASCRLFSTLLPTRCSCKHLPSPAGGFFDGKTSAEERQRYLLDTIKSSTGQQRQAGASGADGAGAGAGQLSNAQLNKLLARGEGELELFGAEDARMQVGRSRRYCSWG